MVDSIDKNALAAAAYANAHVGRNGWYRASCPFCILRRGTPDKRWSWGILPETGKWHCFRCGIAGRLRSEKSTFRPKNREPLSLEFEVDGSGDAIAARDAEEVPEASTQPYTFTLLGDDYSFALEAARDFLKSRGVSRSVAKTVGIGACYKGRYKNRVIVPITDLTSNWIGFVARTYAADAIVNYLYPKGMPRGSWFFNHSAVFSETEEPLLIVEGVFDALPFYPHAVACLGKPTDDQLEVLRAAKRPLVVCLDGDAWREGKWTAELLRLDGLRAAAVKLPPCQDPNSVPRAWLQREAQLALTQQEKEST